MSHATTGAIRPNTRELSTEDSSSAELLIVGCILLAVLGAVLLGCGLYAASIDQLALAGVR